MEWKMLENFEKYLYSLKREGDRKKKIVIDEIERIGERYNERDKRGKSEKEREKYKRKNLR
jgi:hypothetical protein